MNAMFGTKLVLFKLLGFEVKVDPSWIFLAVLVVWSLATGYFPSRYPGLDPGTYWSMGVIGAAGLFLSIVFHELSHSVVARRYGMPMKGITLFIFGGVAEMDEEPPTAKAEFAMAIAGPLASLALAAVFYGLSQLLSPQGMLVAVSGVLGYLAAINAMLAIFNVVPAFPLDGGRVLRAMLWRWHGDLRRATRTAARIGSAFGTALIALGIVSILAAEFVAGMWWFLIGMFLRDAAQGSYLQMRTRHAFEGETVRRFMTPEPVTVSPEVTIRDFVQDWIYRYHYDLFPVVSDAQLIGCIDAKSVKRVPRDRWAEVTVGEIASPCSETNTVGPDDDAVRVLSVMARTNSSRLMVVDGRRLVGVVVLRDLLQLLALKMDLEEID
jgi:Zn-dependent protease/CBS domain-containing protein